MAVTRTTLTAKTEAEIDEMMSNKGQAGYSESYYTNKRECQFVGGGSGWAVDVETYSG